MIRKMFEEVKRELSKKVDVNIGNIVLQAKYMDKKTLGLAYHHSGLIVINTKYFNKEKGYESLKEVLIHEFFHIIAYKIYKKNVRHGKEYKDLFTRYGYDRRLGNATLRLSDKQRGEFKYHHYCSKCGKLIGKSNRRILSYISGCCEATIINKEVK